MNTQVKPLLKPFYSFITDTDSYYPTGYNNSTSDFSVSNRLLNTQQVHPKPYAYNHNNSSSGSEQNFTYPSTYYGWLSEQGTIRKTDFSIFMFLPLYLEFAEAKEVP